MLTVRWYSLIPNQEEFCHNALQELARKLEDRYPQVPIVQFKRIAQGDVKYIPELISHWQRLLRTDRLFVFCSGTESFAVKATSENEKAQWGVALPGVYGLAWEPGNKYLIWHECLHALYADDCYDPRGRTVCEEPFCIMQYIPTESNCGSDLVICKKNLWSLEHMNQ